MSDDSFIREVDEQLREDRVKEAWARYGNYVIGLAVLVVLATAAWRGWEYYSDSRAARDGDRYINAMEFVEAQQADEARLIFEDLAKGGSGQYPALSQLRLAIEAGGRMDRAAAIAAFDAIAADGSADKAFRDIARLRAGILAVDTQDYASVRARLEPMAAAGEPYRHVARQALGVSAMKAGELEAAFGWFNAVSEDAESTPGARNLAGTMLGILAGKGIKASQ